MSVAERARERTPSAARSSNLPLFRDRLPRRPYCTDQLGAGLRIRGSAVAAAARYIQPNAPHAAGWLVFDVDRAGGAIDWDDVDRLAPPPTIVIENPTSGHAHLLYGLAEPVRTAPDGRLGPLRYAAAVERALRARLDADEGFAGLIVQNPLHPSAWRVTEVQRALWELGHLADWVDLAAVAARPRRDYGLGRNVELFERLRAWSYRAIRQGWPDAEQWHRAVLDRALMLNTSPEPLPLGEVQATARSVARWTLRHLSPAGFSQAQAARGARKGAGRRELLMGKALEMASRGSRGAEIGRALGVSERTVRDWLRRP